MTHPNKREVHSKAMKLYEERKKANQIILEKLTVYLRDNPGMRFNQALYNMNIIKQYKPKKDPVDPYYTNDNYYIEPSEILKRMK